MKKVLMLAPMSSVIERFCEANFRALGETDCEVCVAANFECNEHDSDYRTQLEGSGIKTYQIPFVRGSLLGNLKNVKLIKKLLREERFDLVHCHTETGGILTRLSMRADKKAKYVFTPHGMSFYEGSSLKSRIVYKTIEKWICSKMAGNIAINRGEDNVLRRWNEKTAYFTSGIGLNLDKIDEFRDAGSEIRKEFSIPDSAKVVLSVGELNDNKNHAAVLRALSVLDYDLYYVICGEGEKKDELLSLAEHLDMKDRLILPGYRYDVKKFYFAADLFVFPSFHEGLPVALSEAMAAGLPCAVSRIRGNTDLIENEKMLANPGISKTFEVVIDNLLYDEQLRHTEGQRNKQKIKEYSVSAVTEQLKKIYNEVL